MCWLSTESDQLLAAGAVVVNQIRDKVKQALSYTLSAGVAHNKMLAKLTSGEINSHKRPSSPCLSASGMNKPNLQTIIPMSSVPKFFSTLPLVKVF